MKKDLILDQIIDCYLKSPDFNGLSIRNLDSFDYGSICELLDEGMVEVLSEKEVINPHIKAFALSIPITQQKKNLIDKKQLAVLYPTKKALKDIQLDFAKPYFSMLQQGIEQLRIIYFDIEILERYMNNPKFLVLDDGYRGSICPKDEYTEDETIQYEYIKDYGMAYKKGKQLIRAVAVFVRDLANLDSARQMLWKSFELEKQDNYFVNSGFIKNLVNGEWVTKTWILDALLNEMKVINKQCELMNIPCLFNKTWGTSYFDRPEGFRNIFLPTMKNYYDFVLVLEKITVHNISVKTFQTSAPYISKIERKDAENKDKGSITMLSEWLKTNIRTNENIDDLIIKPMKNIREIRQKPAHELISNKYDVGLYQKQHDLINDTYSAIRAIRLFFSNHPLTKCVNIPEYLVSGEDIVNY